jgi:hypothetical protein
LVLRSDLFMDIYYHCVVSVFVRFSLPHECYVAMGFIVIFSNPGLVLNSGK